MTPADLTLSCLGHGPHTPAMVAGTLIQHGTNPLDALRVARECLASLVIAKRAEVLRINETDVYRLPASVPVEVEKEPTK